MLSVEHAALDDDTVISETQLPLIEQAAELGAVINGYATQIHADAETSSTAATAATSAAESTAADAATATQAADDATASKTAAATSASNAATSETNAAASATAAASSESNAAASAAAAQAAIATDMTGATASAAGAHGLVPAPSAGDNSKFLRGDGTWANVVIPPQSYVGMVIHSTTLDTEAKVIAQYGGTAWIQHSGYMLRGATSGVAANSAFKTGGDDNAIVVQHSHNVRTRLLNGGGDGEYGFAGAWVTQVTGTQFTLGGNVTNLSSVQGVSVLDAGESGTNKNIPNYKSVYIWERTV